MKQSFLATFLVGVFLIMCILQVKSFIQCRRYNFKKTARDIENLMYWLQQNQAKCKSSAIAQVFDTETNLVTTSKCPPGEMQEEKYQQWEAKSTKTLITSNDDDTIEMCPFSKRFNISGTLALTCGRKYFFGTDLMTRDEANALCCNLNMSLVSIESVDNLYCLSRFLTFDLNIVKQQLYWTSAIRNTRGFSWSSNSNDGTINSNLWFNSLKPQVMLTTKKDYCISVLLAMERIASNGIQTMLCAEKYFPLCQAEDARAPSTAAPTTEKPMCESPKCPKVDCKNDAVKGIQYRLEDFINLGSKCNKKKYVLSYSKFTFSEAQSVCCKINFTSISIKNTKEAFCLQELLAKSDNSNKYTVAWTSGTSQDCKKKWIWCNIKQQFSAVDKFWATLQPANKRDHERCVNFGKAEFASGIFDSDCDVLLPVLCEQHLMQNYSTSQANHQIHLL